MTTTSFNINQQLTSVRLAATANIAGLYSNGPLNNGVGATLTATSLGALVIDGVNVNQGDRILLDLQTNANEDGIYVVNNPGAPLSLWVLERASDFQSLEQLIAGQYFTVDAGTIKKGNMFVLAEPLPSAIGSGTIGFNFVNVGNSGGGGPFLTVAGNLSDLSNSEIANQNLGFGSGQILVLTDADFIAGVYTLTNPAPDVVSITSNIAGKTLRLPPAIGPGSFSLSLGPQLISTGTQEVAIKLNSGAGFVSLPAKGSIFVKLSDKSTSDGTWIAIGTVTSINNHTGLVLLGANSNQLYITPFGSDLTGDGSISFPFQTYEKARTFAISQSASATNPFVIIPMGVFSITGNMIISPFINIAGQSIENSKFNLTGQLLLDASWGLTTNPQCLVQNVAIAAAGNANLQRTIWQANSILIFNFVDFSTTPILLANGAGTNPNPEIIAFYNCIAISSSPNFNIVDLSSIFVLSSINANAGISLTTTINSAVANAVTLVQAALFVLQSCTFSTTSTGSLFVILEASTELGSTITIDGPNTILNLDSASYQVTPIFTGGATISQVNILSTTDGINTSPYTPINFTPIPTLNYRANSLTATIAGIDAALATGGNVTLQEAYDNGTSPTKGNISLNANTDPINIINTVSGGNQNSLQIVNNTANSLGNWGLDLSGQNNAPTIVKYARINVVALSPVAGTENGALTIKVVSGGLLGPAMFFDGSISTTTSEFLLNAINGAKIFQHTIKLTSNITYDGTQLGSVLITDDLANHDIAVPAVSFSSFGDDSFTVQALNTFNITLTPSGGATINGVATPHTITPGVRVTMQLFDSVAHSWVATFSNPLP